MTKQYSREQELKVKGLGVFELRGLAREIGIKSPTTKKREELIALILEQFKNGLILEPEGKRKGRPFKKLASIDDILNSITNENKALKEDILTYDNIITFAQDTPVFALSLQDDNAYKFEGILRQCEKNYAFTTKGKWVFFKEEVEYFSKLKKGDKIQVEAKPMVQEGQFVVTKILKINGINAKDYYCKIIPARQQIISQENIPFNGTKLLVGRRNAYMFSNDLYEDSSFKSLIEYCKENNIKLVVLGINTSFENQIMFKDCEFKNFTTIYGTTNEINFNKVIDCINYVEQLNERGHKILFFILDILEVLRLLDRCFKCIEEDYNDKTKVVLKKIMELGRAYSDGSSTTLLIGYNELDKNNEIMVNEVLRVSKRIN